MRVLLVDNYDSFTYNVADLLARLGAEVEVVRNDAGTADGMLAGAHDAIVLSPGPGGPDEAGVSMELVQRAIDGGIPLLGICLGMQCIGAAHGARIDRLGGVVHGSASQVLHDGEGLFAGMPPGFDGGRYHSLVVAADSLPPQLLATAHTADGLLMGLRHVTVLVEGVQFHPESILTPSGDRLLANFLVRAAAARGIEFTPRTQGEEVVA
jgi:anthranilate synthase component II